MGALQRNPQDPRRATVPRDWLKHTRNAELVVILGEDIAALAGLCDRIRLPRGCRAHRRHALGRGGLDRDRRRADRGGDLHRGAHPHAADRQVGRTGARAQHPRAASTAIPAIDELLNTITLQFGPKVMLAVKVRMQPGLTIDDAVAHINELERQIKRRHPEVGWCFVEPDVTD